MPDAVQVQFILRQINYVNQLCFKRSLSVYDSCITNGYVINMGDFFTKVDDPTYRVHYSCTSLL